jgi:hypothetical protein
VLFALSGPLVVIAVTVLHDPFAFSRISLLPEAFAIFTIGLPFGALPIAWHARTGTTASLLAAVIVWAIVGLALGVVSRTPLQ